MNTEQLFRATLEKLAAEGVQEAVLALKLAECVKQPTIVQLASIRLRLHHAHSALLEALASNDRSWNRGTDRCINVGLSTIVDVLGELA